MMMRVIALHQIAGLEDMKLVATSCFNAKNRLCNRAGLSPLQAVTGKNNVVPQSIMDQLCSGQVRCTINDELEVRDALGRAERIRSAAVDSFNGFFRSYPKGIELPITSAKAGQLAGGHDGLCP